MARDLQIIELGSTVWNTVSDWANGELNRLRDQREEPGADVRKLDQALGGIVQLKALLALPAAIRKERNRDPVMGDKFDIPNI